MLWVYVVIAGVGGEWRRVGKPYDDVKKCNWAAEKIVGRRIKDVVEEIQDHDRYGRYSELKRTQYVIVISAARCHPLGIEP